jgi:light-regulated signal transduction histidine kinase (bacteriophytochrome)
LWDVETAKDGSDALALIKSRRPALVLSDVMMPNMNGFELLAAVRSDEQLKTIPVILLSARAGQEATIEGLEKGANDYLVKPFYAGELIARVKAQLDISATRLDNMILEERVRERTRDLERTNQELEQFAHVASHDLQEPLRKVRTFAGMLENYQSLSPSQMGDYLKKISTAAQRMSTLIANLLNFSKLSDKAAEYEQVDLNKVFDDVCRDFDLLILEKDAAITRTSLPVIDAIPLQMDQLFHNLIGNALKFTANGRRPEISLTSSEIDGKHAHSFPGLNPTETYLRIELRDNGIGFDQQYADHIFTIFKRLNSGTAYSGTGIGLALCKKIVLNHNGILFATSEKGSGSVFTVVLPKAQARRLG